MHPLRFGAFPGLALLALALALALSATPAAAAPVTSGGTVVKAMPSGGSVTWYYQGPNAQFNIHEVTTVEPISGSHGDGLDSGFTMTVGGSAYSPSTVDLTNDTLTGGVRSLAGLDVTQSARFSSTHAAMRILATLTNPTGAAITTTVAFTTNLGSDGGTIVRATQSGDTSVSSADRWTITSDGYYSDPIISMLTHGENAQLAPSSVTLSGDNLQSSFSVTVPAGQTRRIMLLMGAGGITSTVNTLSAAQAGVTNVLQSVDTLPADLVSDLGVARGEIVNWQFGPSVAMTPTPAATNGRQISYAIAFNGSVTGFTDSDLTVTGTSSGWSLTSLTGSGASYTAILDQDPSGGEGTVNLQIAANSVVDSNARTGPSVATSGTAAIVDRTDPGVASWSTPTTPTSAATVAYTLTFTEAVSGIAAGDFANAGTATGCVITPSAASGTAITVTLSSCGEGTVRPELAAVAVADAAGNPGPAAASTATAVTIDRTAPTASWGTVPSSPSGLTTLTYVIDFSESVSGVAASDFANGGTATGCVIAPSAASGTSITVTVTSCSATGTVILRLNANSVTDGANAGPAANVAASTVTIDRGPPTATWTTVPSTPTSATTLTYAITFSKAVTGLDGSDITNAGTATGCVFSPAASSGTVISVVATGCIDGTVVARIAAGAVVDAAGNTGPSSAVNATLVTLVGIRKQLQFRITGLGTTPYTAIEANAHTGDDRGGIAITTSKVLLTGDSGMGRFNLTDLGSGARAVNQNSTWMDGIASDLRTRTAYAFNRSGSSNLTTLTALDPTTGLQTGTVVPLSSAIPVAGSGNGIFSGYGRIVFVNGSTKRVYDIDMPSGVVDDLGVVAIPSTGYSATLRVNSETWATWGVAEYFDERLHLAYSYGYPAKTVQRIAVGTDARSTVASLPTGVSDMASFTVDPSTNRWYFHYEGSSGYFGSRDETIGFAPATVVTTPSVVFTPPASPSTATSLTFGVAFSEAVTDVTAADFSPVGATAAEWSVTSVSGFGREYTVVIGQTGSAEGTVGLQMAAEGARWTAGADLAVPTQAVDSDLVVVDRTTPTVTWSTTPSTPTATTGSLSYALAFSEPISGLAAADLSNAGTATGCTFSPSAASGTSATVSVSGCSQGTVVLRLAAGAITDGVNTAPAAVLDAATVTIDRTAPTATWTSTPASLASTTTLAYTLSFSEPISGLAAGDFANAGTATGCVATPQAASGTSIAVDVTGCSTGTLILRLASGSVTDGANAGPASAATAATVTIDRTAPTATWTSAPSSRTSAASLAYGLAFSESASVVAAGDFTNEGTATGCVFSPSASAGTAITITVSSCSEGTVILRLAAGAVADAAGNQAPASALDAGAVTIDRTAPAAVWLAPGSPTNVAAPVFTVNFSEPISALTGATIANAGTATGCSFAPAASAGTSIVVTATGCSEGTVAPRLAASSVLDGTGNAGPAAPVAASAVVIDRTAPTVVWTGTPASPTASLPASYTMLFSERVSGLAASDLTTTGTATGCTLTPSAASGTAIAVAVTGCTGDGTVVPRLAAAGVQDDAGNAGPAAASGAPRIYYDTTPPIGSWTRVPGSPNAAGSAVAPLQYGITFQENVSGIDAADFANAGTATGCVFTPDAATALTATELDVDVTNCSTGTVVLELAQGSIIDAASNAGPRTPLTAAGVSIERDPPTAAWSGTPASPTNATAITYTLTFSTVVNGIAGSDFENAGAATGCTFTPSAASGRSITVTVTTCNDGTLAPRLRATTVQDDAGNDGPASAVTTSEITIDQTAPAAIWTSPESPTNAESLSYRLSFSGPITGLSAADIANVGTATGCLIAVSAADGSTFGVDVTGCGQGDVVLRLASGSVLDPAGNAGPATAQSAPRVVVDRSAPTAAWTAQPVTPVANATLQSVVTFDETVSGLATGDFVNTGTADGCTFVPDAATGASIGVSISGCGEGTVVVSLEPDTVADRAGNVGPAARVLSLALDVDLTAPTATWTAVPSSPTNAATLAFTLSFDEVVSGVTGDGIENGGTATGCAFSASALSSSSYTVVARDCSEGTVRPRLLAGVGNDSAGNSGPAAAVLSASVTVDRTPPAASWTATPAAVTNAATLTYILTPDSPVSGITAADFAIGGTATGCVITPSATTAGPSSPVTVTLTSCSEGTVALEVGAGVIADDAANAGPASAVVAASVEIDRTAPANPLIKTGPAAAVTETTATFTLEGEAGGALECSLDGAAFAACTSPLTTSTLVEGDHTLRLRDTDAAGNTSAIATRAWTVDLTAPTAAWTAAPSTPTNAAALVWTLAFSEGVTGIDAADFANAGTATGCVFDPGTDTGATRALTATGCSEGTVAPQLAAAVAVDRVALTGPAAPVAAGTVVVDRTAPAVVALTAPSGEQAATQIAFELAFSEPLGVAPAAADFSVGGTSTGWAVTAVTGTGPYTVTLTASDAAPDGTVELTFGGGAVADLAGNALGAVSASASASFVRGSAPAPGAEPVPAGTPASAAPIDVRTDPTVTRTGTAEIPVSCRSASSCETRSRLVVDGKVVREQTGTIAAGGDGRVRFALTPALQRRLAREGSLQVTFAVTVVVDGVETTTEEPVTLEAPAAAQVGNWIFDRTATGDLVLSASCRGELVSRCDGRIELYADGRSLRSARGRVLVGVLEMGGPSRSRIAQRIVWTDDATRALARGARFRVTPIVRFERGTRVQRLRPFEASRTTSAQWLRSALATLTFKGEPRLDLNVLLDAHAAGRVSSAEAARLIDGDILRRRLEARAAIAALPEPPASMREAARLLDRAFALSIAANREYIAWLRAGATADRPWRTSAEASEVKGRMLAEMARAGRPLGIRVPPPTALWP